MQYRYEYTGTVPIVGTPLQKNLPCSSYSVCVLVIADSRRESPAIVILCLCREMSQMEEDARRKGLNVRLRNAEPYREFQNTEDNDRSESTNRLNRIQIRIWSQTFVAIFSLLFLVTCVVFLSFLQCDLPL